MTGIRSIFCAKCGLVIEESRIFKYSYCKKCHAEYMRENRRRHSELSPEQRKKANARTYANQYKKRGVIEKQPCCVCGSLESEMHHDDYDKPTQVRWYCREHHLEMHKKNNDER